MDVAIDAPVRLQATSSTPISSKAAQSRVEHFLAHFGARCTPSNAITVQLRKLRDSLQEEQQQLKR
ncbi:hypothetical protein PLICRDRAFT_451987 [Plicaturopsis crispa FD-325 SS-3]|uniref:Uncharacterized protein n=1 Tax=Plicaturopsis crispa FD-325 SS-3 TaxID=944288 RepID=A0A0C9SW05_PLICR|nr:hypothetical protein PLICRDRAFT_451987 [Plicaturopsis crispa FD-325 SS-3]